MWNVFRVDVLWNRARAQQRGLYGSGETDEFGQGVAAEVGYPDIAAGVDGDGERFQQLGAGAVSGSGRKHGAGHGSGGGGELGERWAVKICDPGIAGPVDRDALGMVDAAAFVAAGNNLRVRREQPYAVAVVVRRPHVVGLVDGHAGSAAAGDEVGESGTVGGDASNGVAALVGDEAVAFGVHRDGDGELETGGGVTGGSRERRAAVGHQRQVGVAVVDDPGGAVGVDGDGDGEVHAALGKSGCPRDRLAGAVKNNDRAEVVVESAMGLFVGDPRIVVLVHGQTVGFKKVVARDAVGDGGRPGVAEEAGGGEVVRYADIAGGIDAEAGGGVHAAAGVGGVHRPVGGSGVDHGSERRRLHAEGVQGRGACCGVPRQVDHGVEGV